MIRWSPWQQCTLYINVDAVVFSYPRRMRVSVIIRNHIDDCLAACSELIDEVTTLELAEALAMPRTISLASEEGFGKLMVVVSDCLSLIP
jgi:hypothetical protein